MTDEPGTEAIRTIGHSTRTIEEFTRLLRVHGVTLLVDIRTIPRSRHNPQFNKDALPGPLSHAGIEYAHHKNLGGLRRPRFDSPNTGWKNSSFRGFADYMQTAEFETALGGLIGVASGESVVLMCAEAVPWRCHRSLIADALLARGRAVEHILSAARSQPHTMTPFARLEGTRVTYPGEPELPLTPDPADSP